MTDLLVQIGLSNLLLSGVLAGLAYAVHRRGRYPTLAHLLWVLVLVKVVTPPLFTLPVALGPGDSAVPGDLSGAFAASSLAVEHADPSWLIEHGATALVTVWLLGSLMVLAVSALRIGRFGRLLGQTSRPAPADIQVMAATLSRQLGLRSRPPIYLATARLSPMTWWTRGQVRIVLPDALLEGVDDEELRWVVAHELAHIKRRDHLVRWLEWLACVSSWWNPVVWWARRNLRFDEESACDAFVLERLDGQPRSYARILLAVVELLSSPAARPPAVATGIGSTESLERRLTRIISPGPRRRASRRVVTSVMSVALALTAFGFSAPRDEPASAPEAALAAADASLAVAQGTTPETLGGVAPGDDRYARLSATLPGSATEPTLAFVGTASGDSFAGSARGETIVGNAGADDLSGGAGRDVIRGGAGRDVIRGGRGDDHLSGGAQGDVIDGGAGHDVIRAGAGNDVVKTWRDGLADRVDCGSGNRDRAVIDSADTAERCEVVVVRDPS